jgi:hypothetical protein
MAPDDPAAGPDDRLGHEQPPRSVERARQAVGHRDCAEAVAVKAASAARRPGVALVPGAPVAAPAATPPPSPSVALTWLDVLGCRRHLLLVAAGALPWVQSTTLCSPDPRTAPAAGWARRPSRAPPAARSQGSGHRRAAARSAGIAGSGWTGSGRSGSPPHGSGVPRLGGNRSVTGAAGGQDPSSRAGRPRRRVHHQQHVRGTCLSRSPPARPGCQPPGGPGGSARHHSRNSPTRATPDVRCPSSIIGARHEQVIT